LVNSFISRKSSISPKWMDLSSIFLLFLKSTWFYHSVFIEGDIWEQLLHIIVLSPLAMHSQSICPLTGRAVVISETCSLWWTISCEWSSLIHLNACPYLFLSFLWCELMNMFNLSWCEAINFVLQQSHFPSDSLQGVFHFVRTRANNCSINISFMWCKVTIIRNIF